MLADWSASRETLAEISRAPIPRPLGVICGRARFWQGSGRAAARQIAGNGFHV